jgi:hypothetical protein
MGADESWHRLFLVDLPPVAEVQRSMVGALAVTVSFVRSAGDRWAAVRSNGGVVLSGFI